MDILPGSHAILKKPASDLQQVSPPRQEHFDHQRDYTIRWKTIDSASLEALPTPFARTVFAQAFPGLPITELMGRILRDEMYREWQQIRNVLAHRVATAGRAVQSDDSSFSGPPLSVTAWAGDIPLDAKMTASRYDWLRETINSGVEETAAFAEQQLPYTEDQLRQLAW